MIQKILVAVHHGDQTSQHVFQEAIDLAKATGASLKLLHVLAIDDSEAPGIFSLINTPENKRRWEEFERPGLDLLKSMAAVAIAAGIPVEYAQTIGRPGSVICETAKQSQADLVMLGRRGLSGVGELLLGSVSNYVTHYAPCTVMVIQGTAPVVNQRDRSSQVSAVR